VKPHDQSFPEPTGNLPSSRPESRAVAGRIERVAPPPSWEAGPAPALSGAPDLKALLHGLRRRWFAAFTLGTTLAALSAAAAWYFLSPKYTAVSQLRVLALPDKLIPDQYANRSEFVTYIRTVASQLRGRPVIKEALKQDKVVQLRLEDLVRDGDALAFVEEELKVDYQETNEIVTVTLGSSDPNISVTLLRAVVDSFIKQVPDKEDDERRKRVASLDKAFLNATKELEVLTKSLESKAKNSKGVADPRALPLQQLDDLASLRQARQDRNTVYNNLVMARISLEAYLAHIKALENNQAPDSPVEAAVEADPQVKDLQKAIKASERMLRNLGGTYLPSGEAEARRLAGLKADLATRRKEAREELKARAKGGRDGSADYERFKLEAQVQTLERQHELLVAAVKELEEKVKDYGQIDPELQDKLREIGVKEGVVKRVGEQRDREKLELDAAKRIEVTSPADLQRKDSRKQIAATVVAPVLTLLAVCAGLAWFDCRQRRVRSASHVARGLGIPVVGAVPNLPHLERHLVGVAGETGLEGHPVMESIDGIRTLLLCDAQAEATRVVLVTSAGPGEGKTTLAAHLAGSLARAGRKTLLIDGDLRAPAAHQLFELPQQPGFSEVLLGEVEAAEAVQPTPIDGLALMPAGLWDREVMQALARDGLEGIFEKLLEEFDFIVIDSHPVQAATDALLIGQRSDAVIVSVLREVSRAPQVYAACQRLAALGIRVLGAVVNGTDPDEVITPPEPAVAMAG
jgi:capsular exopolysaccharide synthesis family protein